MATLQSIKDYINARIGSKTAFNSITPTDEQQSHEFIVDNLQSDFAVTDVNDARYIKNQRNNPIVLLQGAMQFGDIQSTPVGSLLVTGGITSANKTNPGGGVSEVVVNFPSVGTPDYMVKFMLISNVVTFQIDAIHPIVSSRNLTNFTFTIEEFSNVTQNLTIAIEITEFNGF